MSTLHREVWQDPETGKITTPEHPQSTAHQLASDVRVLDEALARLVVFFDEVPRLVPEMEKEMAEQRVRAHLLRALATVDYVRDHADGLAEWLRQQAAEEANEQDA